MIYIGLVIKFTTKQNFKIKVFNLCTIVGTDSQIALEIAFASIEDKYI